jgi:hypothetical protein
LSEDRQLLSAGIGSYQNLLTPYQHNIIVVYVIPKSIDIGSVWDALPPGIHDATLGEIKQRFAANDARKAQYEGFARGAEILRRAGCSSLFLDGSFVTDKPNPGDFDACWDPTGVDVARLDPVLLDFNDLRKKQKATFGGEFFPSSVKADGTRSFVEFFQIDNYTGKAKGIIRIQLQQKTIA